MNASRRYKAAVIGAGVMGAGMDVRASQDMPQTHAGGYYNHPSFELVALCDTQPVGGLEAKWGCTIYDDVCALLEQEKPDVVSVALPENKQYEVLKAVLEEESIKAVIAEKPIADTLRKAKMIVEGFDEKNRPLLVNYTRRYSPFYQAMAGRFRSGEERVVSATIRYAKGLWHNGSHAVDLVRILFGEIIEVKNLSSTHDFYDDDPSISAFFKCQHCPNVFLQALDERCYTLFEVDIFTDKNRYVINGDHRDLQRSVVQEGRGIPSGKRLVAEEVEKTDYDLCMVRLMDNLTDVLNDEKLPLCSGFEALKSLELAYDLA